ncbi:helix-turn-helix transcriptional regulator [Actinoallomurus iriomotensis]|uniref:helix-turn-helix transcriptional regulator n=1 Tax=Actinoallomurus iriomotensis TaxID=478107 RepID=UPI002553BD09|nr:helix-turn-helix transcriptional regulator [Actinoallomurus iriomotensis]
MGLCSAALPSVLITLGEHRVPTGTVSLLLATTTLTCAQMAVATFVSAPFAATRVSHVRWEPGPWAAAAVLGVVCSGLGWLANTVLMQRVTAVQGSLVSFTAPVISVLLGTTILGERLSPPRFVAAGIVLAAIMAFSVPSGRAGRPNPRREVRAILELAILGFLSEQALHAYELRRRISALMGHVRPVSDGSLYPALHRLRRQELVTRRAEPGSGGPPRQVFELTDAGRAELRRRLERPDELEISDRNKYFVLLAFLHLPSADAQARVLRQRLEFLQDPRRGFFVDDGRVLRQDELRSPFQAGIQHIARVTSSAERAWLTDMLATVESTTAS